MDCSVFCSATEAPLFGEPYRRFLPAACSFKPREASRGLEPVHLRREDEIVLAQPVYAVGEDRDLGPPPAEADVRVVALLLRQLAHPVHEPKRPPEVPEAEVFPEVVSFDDLPARHLSVQPREIFPFE